ncbi:MAG: hypothetical protein O3C28_20165 [Proteobacteria bacterium]|nr:hypothetical protein [Pseudomonadota bacterium]
MISEVGTGIDLLLCKHSDIVEFVRSSEDLLERNERGAYMESLLAIDKQVDADDFEQIAKHLDIEPTHVPLRFVPGLDLDLGLMSAIVRRYGVSLVDDRAVILFDAVGFSLLPPLEQMTQLNSLSYSINSAYSRLLEKDIDINFARTTTGDGFYIWNRKRGIDANIELYHLMLMTLAVNAIEQQDASVANLVPQLRACLHVGSHYEFYQPEALSPTTFSYLVGEVTIELARMIEHAVPGQIMIGDFRTPMHDYDTGGVEIIDSIEFIDRARNSLYKLQGLELANAEVEEIKCYLTGSRCSDGKFNINQYAVSDKHGMFHKVYNAKLNIHRDHAAPIYLGIQNDEIPDTTMELKHFKRAVK